MSIEFPVLPYANNALEPHVSANTLALHHGKHHKGYVEKLNKAIAGTAYDGMSLDAIIRAAHEASDTGIFNNAAQIWNHTFYWNCLRSPNDDNAPSGALADAINSTFGSFDEFKKQFATAGATNFGSGWTWLVKKADGTVDIVNMGPAGTPLTTGDKPLLCIDVWEHAYYIDYRNLRPKYVEAFWKIVNWDFVAGNMS